MKKLFQKIWGTGVKEGNTPHPSPFHPRSLRVRLAQMDSARFELAGGNVFPLRNLSETGLAMGYGEGGALPDAGQGRIRVGAEDVNVAFHVMWRTEHEAGACFEGDSTPVRSLLRRLFTEELKATEMREVASSRPLEEEPGQPRWFYAPGNYELFFLEHEEKVTRFELEWSGNVLAGARTSAVRFGTIAPEDRQKPEHAKSALVRWQPAVSEENKRKAVRILENIPGLDADSRRKIQVLILS